MNLRKILTATILFFSLYVVGQFKYMDITQKIILVQEIDTSRTFSYEVQDFKLIFAQSDILDYFSQLRESEKKRFQILRENEKRRFQILIDTLTSNSKHIIIKKDFIYDKVYTNDYGNGNIQTGVFRSWKDKRDILSDSFTFIAADLMLEGKVLILSTKKKKLKIEKIICRKVEGMLGSEFLVFELPNKKKIYEIITAIGE